MSSSAVPAAGTSASEPATADDGGLSHRQIVTILIGLMLGLFLAALDQTIVGTAIRTIADDLKGLSVQAWVTTAYLITSTITTPLYGKLSDIYGRKLFFTIAITIFVLGSAACTFSTSMYMLAGFRAIQGIGAGGLFSLALAIIGDIVSPRERAKYQGYFLAVFGTSSVLGPVIGGFLAGQSSIFDITGWRWVFLVNVPIGVIALIVVERTLHVPTVRRDHRIDYWGALALIVCLVPLLTVAEQGREWGWLSGRSVGCYIVGVVGLVLFLLAERAMGDEALIPMRLFRSRTVSVSTIANTVLGIALFGGVLTIPLYLQIVRGSSPTEAGLQLVPLTLGIMIASISSGVIISRTGRYKIFPIIGTTLMTVGLVLFAQIGPYTPLWKTMAVMVVFGLGLGNNFQPLVLALQNAVNPRDIGVATASATFFRQIGGTLGAALFLSVLFSTVPDKIGNAFGTVASSRGFQAALANPNPDNEVNRRFIEQFQSGTAGNGSQVLTDSSFIQQLDPRLARPFLIGFAESMDLVFWLGAGVAALGIIVTILMPELALRTQSGMAAAAAEDAAAAATATTDPTVVPADVQPDSATGDDAGGRHAGGAASDGEQRPPARHSASDDPDDMPR
jgi:EmrB/QacA subfamily drug resistance transporter